MPDTPPDLPELYDLDCAGYEDDLPFYEALARAAGGPVLELGVGTGRIAAHLAGEAFEVWGVDTDDAMLARARAKLGAPAAERLVCGDMRAFELGRAFDLIIAAFGTFQLLLTPGEQAACLRCVESHLTPGGRFAFDVRPWWFASWDEGTSVPLAHEWTRQLPSTGETVIKLASARPDRPRQLQHETHIYDRVAGDGTVRRTISTVDSRFSTRYEIEGLMRSSGFTLDGLHGDFELSPFDEASDSMIIIARKPGEETR